ncbi:MAG: ectonucleotide pyrophosphatase/phosphodiesterase [Acidobacteriota bacterium]|nr:ectonucleotide pyrophosphatase/phosphodiesterase [Acidobacteriota bacterium]
MSRVWLFCLLSILTLSLTASAQRRIVPPVILISIDGLKPDYVLEADRHKLKIPNLRRFVKEGAFATAVTGVTPTVTYPSHTTLVTGVSPAKHGIYANTPFDPFSKNQGGWYWYAEDVRVPTLWEACAAAGLKTAGVDWPVTVGAKIDFNIAQIWRAATPDDRKLIRALSTPGLLTEAEKAIGNYPEGYDYTVEADKHRAAFNVYLLEKKRPTFLTTYFAGLDEVQHAHGPDSREAYAALEEIDVLVGQIRAAAEKLGNGKAVVAVASDHGFSPLNKSLNLNAAFREAGLIEVEAGKVKSWRAITWNSGGTAAVMLKDKNDEDARLKIRQVLRRLAGDPDSGLFKWYEDDIAQKLGGFPDAAFVVGTKPGTYIGGGLEPPVIRNLKPSGGHGFLAELNVMDSSFFIVGAGIQAGKNLGRIDMRDIAPTLAGLLGVKLPMAEGRDQLKR